MTSNQINCDAQPGVIDQNLLPEGIRSSVVQGVNGLDMHVLEAGKADGSVPRLLLLHGFPELAFSWRRIMVPLAAAGFHAIAPDQRGYGRTTGWQNAYDTDLSPFRMPALVRDMLALLDRLQVTSVSAVIGHDFGSPVAAWSALIRPDVFRSVVMMSAPFEGPPSFRSDSVMPEDDVPPSMSSFDAGLSQLSPARKHYQHYYCTPEANADMWDAECGMESFLRAYFHYKSADWLGNEPKRLDSWAADEIGKMPTYYIMDRDKTMAESVAPFLPAEELVNTCQWLTRSDMKFYADEYNRTGFQGGLNWYRCTFSAEQLDDLRLFSGREIDVPSLFIAGDRDWGVYQRPGSIERMQKHAGSQLMGCELIKGAGHWVQQEQPEQVVEHLLKFARNCSEF